MNPNRDFLEPKHNICNQGEKAKLATGEGYSDVHDAFVACLGGEVKERGGHADSVKAHVAKVNIGPLENTGKHYWGEKSITVPVEPSYDPFAPIKSK